MHQKKKLVLPARFDYKHMHLMQQFFVQLFPKGFGVFPSIFHTKFNLTPVMYGGTKPILENT
jgi:hypothetical protein